MPTYTANYSYYIPDYKERGWDNTGAKVNDNFIRIDEKLYGLEQFSLELSTPAIKFHKFTGVLSSTLGTQSAVDISEVTTYDKIIAALLTVDDVAFNTKIFQPFTNPPGYLANYFFTDATLIKVNNDTNILGLPFILLLIYEG